jgi:hypothetical protein
MNKIYWRYIILILYAMLFNSIHALQLDHIKTLIVQPGKVLNANFVQERYFKELPKPIISKGTIEVWGGKGLEWKTNYPFVSSIVITEKGIYRNNDVLLIEGGGIFKAVSNILDGSFTQEIQYFNIDVLPKSTINKWHVKLIPNTSPINKIIKSMNVVGDQYIKKIIIYRPNGDYDVIKLTNHIVTDINKHREWQYD